MKNNLKFYKKWNKALIDKNYTIKKAIKNLDLTALQICLVIEKNKKLIGTITDGDIRRALLNGCTIDSKITKYINYKPKKIFRGFTNDQLKNLLEKYKIALLPVVNNLNQIIGLVSWDNLKKDNSNFNEPIIFIVGGKGTRLAPITNKIPKPMIKINGVPILEKLVLKAKSEGFYNFYFIINYLGNKIIKYFGDGKRLGVNIEYIREKKPLGTAGGLGLTNFDNKTVVVSNGDVLTEVSYKNLLSYHKNNKNHLTIGAKNVKTINPYGVIKFSKSKKKIEKLIEKPIENNYVSAGVYVFETKLFSFVEKNNYLDMTSLINFFIKRNKRIGACPIHENWIDIGSPADLNKVINKNE
jgi:dTDP-glucose pyrophosphorylase